MGKKKDKKNKKKVKKKCCLKYRKVGKHCKSCPLFVKETSLKKGKESAKKKIAKNIKNKKGKKGKKSKKK